jgi:hypothetical protein
VLSILFLSDLAKFLLALSKLFDSLLVWHDGFHVHETFAKGVVLAFNFFELFFVFDD